MDRRLRHRSPVAQAPAAVVLPPYVAAVLADSPQAYWAAEEPSGATVVDITGNGHVGTMGGTEGVHFVRAFGAIFAGVGPTVDVSTSSEMYVDPADDGAFSPAGASGALSLEILIQPDTVSASAQMVIAKHQEYQLRIESSGTLLWDVNESGAASIMECTSSALTANNAYHVVATYDRAVPRARLFVNGTLVSTDTTANGSKVVISHGQGIRVGSRYDSAGSRFDGTWGHAAVYNYELSGAQVSAHYALL